MVSSMLICRERAMYSGVMILALPERISMSMRVRTLSKFSLSTTCLASLAFTVSDVKSVVRRGS